MYEDSDDFIGWKLISKDVFRRPLYGGLFAPVLGGGIQIVIATVSSIIALYLGWYHPAQPGAFTRWFTVFFMLASLVGGYCSARIYKVFRGKSWVLNSILVCIHSLSPSIYTHLNDLDCSCCSQCLYCNCFYLFIDRLVSTIVTCYFIFWLDFNRLYLFV